jgi:hypothetical protein
MITWMERENRLFMNDRGQVCDSWGRPLLHGPEERWSKDDPRFADRMMPEPCDDSRAPDGCRKRWLHVGMHSPTPEQEMEPGWEPGLGKASNYTEIPEVVPTCMS